MTFGIIGYGRFGGFWADKLKKYGEVLVYDSKDISAELKSKKNIRTASLADVSQVDMLFLTMPIHELENVCQDIKSFLSPGTVVIDVCSVKLYAAEVMQRVLSKGQPIIAGHPLFGPQTVERQGLKGQKFTVFSLSATDKQMRIFTDILQDMKLEVINASPEENDQAMTLSHALLYYIGMGLGALDIKEQKICTPDYPKLFTIHDLVKNNSWELFRDLETLNPYAKEVRVKFINELQRVEDLLMQEEKCETLECVREGIDTIDEEIIRLLVKRFALAAQAGRIKKADNKRIVDAKREREIIKKYKKLAQEQGLDEKFVQDFFRAIITESKRIQKKDVKK